MTELRILVCDDEPAMLDIMMRRLDKMGIKPDRAEDGAIAQSLIQENDYDLIVTDIYMPEATGLELLQMAKDKNPQTQVVMVTASATLDNAIDALNHGAYGYLTKPFDHLSVFDNMVSRSLEFRRLLLANERMAEAQKRRGDMLEDEVTNRVRQLRLKQKGLIDLLNCLPDGILVVEEGGKLTLTSPKAEEWLARDRRSEEQPIQQFISQLHSEWAENVQSVQLDGAELRLIAVDYPNPEGVKRKAVLMRRAEEDAIGQGSLVEDTVNEIKRGLAWLFQQDLGDAVKQAITNLANQLNMLEQMTGLASGSNGGPPELAPAELPTYLQHDPTLDPVTGELIEQQSGNGRSTAEEQIPKAEPQIEVASEPESRPAAEGEEPPAPEPDLGAPAAQADEVASAEVELTAHEEAPAEIEEAEPAVDLEARLGAFDDTPVVGRAEDGPPLEEAPVSAPPAEPEPELTTEQPQQEAAADEPTVAVEPEAQPETAAPAEQAATVDRPTSSVKEPLWRRLAKRAGVSKPLSEPAQEAREQAKIQEPEQAPEPAQVEAEPAEAAPEPSPEPAEDAPKPALEPAKAVAEPPEPAEAAPGAPSVAQPERGKAASWPPVLPSEDPEFTEELDVTG